MQDNQLEIKGGLIPPKYDPRRFSYKKAFGSAPLDSIPTDFVVGNPTLYDQKGNDICSAVSTCYASEVQEGVPLSPEYTFYKTKILTGNYKSWGADPDTACKSHIKFGAIGRSDSPFNLLVDGRDTVANPDNWKDKNVDEKAGEHKKFSYFALDHQGDMFDSIRSALWEQKDTKKLAMTGAGLRKGWFDSPDGIVPLTSLDLPASNDMFVIKGVKTINGKPYLIANFSFGLDSWGDKGNFYIPREVANRDLLFAYMFVDIDSENEKQRQWGILAKIFDKMISILRIMQKYYGSIFH